MTPLSPREQEVARLVAEGLADKEIAIILVIGAGTVKTYVDRIALKIGANKARNRRVAIAVWTERKEKPCEADREVA